MRAASNGRQFPHHSVSPSDLRVLLRESEVAAVRMVRRFQLPTCDRDDLRQDILVDLLCRIRAFDPKRGTFGAFVGTIIAHRAARLTKRWRRQRATMISLDQPMASAGAMTLGDMIAEADGISASLGQPFDRFAEIELRLDLIRALSALHSAELGLCVKLTEHTPAELSRCGKFSRATLYRRLRNIRLRLLAEGISCP
jgi:DNA-directed RNA polymerase specialized sigma24 family protein